MPQAPTANMGLILPTDHGDPDQWDLLLDTLVRTIDQHNHAAGSGAKISLSQLAIDADISFVDAGGNKHAIYNLKAIDFFPVATTDVTGFAGAFFLNSADNELYYRTTAGANVKFTNGATINVGAFTGGFGGDYTSAGALAIFDDASDAYWFQQQVGAAVRQYAKMQCADLKLFEFKAVGASPVPVQAVTLKSPAALAAGYTLTFPGALPGSQVLTQVDAAGNVVLSNTIVANSDIVISGTGTYKQGSKQITKTISMGDVVASSGGGVANTAAGGGIVIQPSSIVTLRLSEFQTHWRLLNVTITFDNAANRNGTTGQVKRSGSGDPATTAFTNVGAAMSATGTARRNVSAVNIQPGSGESFFCDLQTGVGITATAVNLIIDYDVP